MQNRKLSSPILYATLLFLTAQPALLSRAETSESISTPLAGNPPAASPVASPVRGPTYTVVAGDSLTSIARKFNTTRKKLEKLNDLTSSKVKPGQVLLLAIVKSPKSTTVATTPKAKAHHSYAMAQPVQDFDIPASTFGSCPVPPNSEDEEADSPEPIISAKPAPVAKLVSPAEMSADQKRQSEVLNASPAAHEITAPTGFSAKHFTNASPTSSLPLVKASPTPIAPAIFKFSNRNYSQPSGPNPLLTTPADDWGNRFTQEARALGNQGIEYDDDWRPPGESHSWTMDCSNTSRYLYKVTTGIQLPRTASDQYYYLHLQGKAWDVPQNSQGWADGEFLRRNLKPGDLLFWENTYRPERQPPITHVMVFLGTNAKGQWIMAGSQSSRGGEHNRRNGGPDVYVFRPSQPCGGYTTWLGMVHHQGRFCAFGRPLEADRSKLAVASMD
jgi:LysM repeat protein